MYYYSIKEEDDVIPSGFAHGFRVISETAHLLYKVTDFYAPESERTIAWNDRELKVDWQLNGEADIFGQTPARRSVSRC